MSAEKVSQPFLDLGILNVGYAVIYDDRGTLRVSESLEDTREPEIHESSRDAGVLAQALQQRFPGLQFTVCAIVPLATIGGVDA